MVVCLSEPLMTRTSSALSFERFASRSCVATLTSQLSLFHFSDHGFKMLSKSELNRSVISGNLKKKKIEKMVHVQAK